MKAMKNIAILSFSLIFSVVYGMEEEMEVYHPQYTAEVQAYFSPIDRKAMTDDLFSFLDNAQRSIYVAMYWITDDSLLDRLIAAKKRNIDVQICLDGESPNVHHHFHKLKNNNIKAAIFPSKKGNNGIMHNKFFVIDSKTVITGSANFTKPAMDSKMLKFNYENMLILYSPQIAAEYLKAFFEIQNVSSQ